MTTFVTSDLHFFHKNILKYEPAARPFSCISEMHETIITNWNSTVKNSDTVFILGDVSFGNVNDTWPILSRLSGELILIAGNHDHKLISSSLLRSRFTEIKDYHQMKVNDKHIVMFHFPIESWDRRHHGSIHLHGHLHSKNQEILSSKRWDVGLDGNNCFVYNLDDLIDTIELRYDPSLDHNFHHARIKE